MNKEKMMTSAKTLHTISRVSQKIFLAGMIVLLIFSVLVLVVKDDKFVTNSSSLAFGNLELTLAEGALPTANVQRWRVAIGLAATAVIVGFLSYALREVSMLLAPITEGRPFEGGASKRLRKLAFLTLIGGFLYQILESVGDLMLTVGYQVSNLFREGLVQSVDVNFRLNLTFFFAALLLGLLSFVFRYGEELQRESDETL